MSDHVILLGTKGGPAIRPGSTMPTSSFVLLADEPIVVDCGLGVTRALTDQGFALENLSVIFITHLHSDHYLELGPLLHTAWTAGLSSEVEIWGPRGLARYWDNFLLSMQDDIELRIADEGRVDFRNLITLRVLDEGEVTRIGQVDVKALRVDHPPLTDCFALSFATEEKRVVFSADTAFFPPLADFAKGADLLIHEAMLGEALEALVKRAANGDDRLMKHLKRSHTLASDAARLATQAQVGALALHHLLPSDDPTFTPKDWAEAVNPHWDGDFYLGSDGLKITL
ncbi:MAG: MBL fold metallo-hydrolase [Pseudomonadota bacterium]